MFYLRNSRHSRRCVLMSDLGTLVPRYLLKGMWMHAPSYYLTRVCLSNTATRQHYLETSLPNQVHRWSAASGIKQALQPLRGFGVDRPPQTELHEKGRHGVVKCPPQYEGAALAVGVGPP